MVWQSVLLSVHFFVLGAHTAGIMAAISSLRNYLTLFEAARKTVPFFIILYLFFGVYAYDVPKDILPVAASCIGTYALFYTKGLTLRFWLFIGGMCWLVHNAVSISIGPTLMEMMLVAANGRTVIYLLRQKSSKT